MTTNTIHVRIGDLTAQLYSEIVDNEILDTRVTIESGLICWVAGSERDNFIKALNEVISNYRI